MNGDGPNGLRSHKPTHWASFCAQHTARLWTDLPPAPVLAQSFQVVAQSFQVVIWLWCVMASVLLVRGTAICLGTVSVRDRVSHGGAAACVLQHYPRTCVCVTYSCTSCGLGSCATPTGRDGRESGRRRVGRVGSVPQANGRRHRERGRCTRAPCR